LTSALFIANIYIVKASWIKKSTRIVSSITFVTHLMVLLSSLKNT